ncbi:hypothetical protein F751_4702 [Auxenochlorella protothecoides]|uniref:Uncharacterized protein n=1 Tax=Auxenochlorella protothecoides TaxID=3075 RepID=A0A087SKF5_AUXPR|nr:hypothetical protein F751_4702 [Auxenochlorella protothecoides]KFM26209.1 hypothetical protein F751_4702 [Auxenochlorella protothecoides]
MAATNLMIHTLLMGLVPLITFVVAKRGTLDVLLEILSAEEVSDSNRTVLGGLLALLGVNVVIVSFMICAWYETPAIVPAKKRE